MTASRMQIAILQAFVPNQGDAWNYTLDALSRFFEAALAGTIPEPEQEQPLELIDESPPAQAQELIGAYLESARLLGQRTARCTWRWPIRSPARISRRSRSLTTTGTVCTTA